MSDLDIQDPQLEPRAGALVIKEVDGQFMVGAFFGPEVEQNSITRQMIDELLQAVVGVSKDASLISDTTDTLSQGSDQPQEGK
ncbi:hypothetical protein [Burkholderia sp. Bp8990]|uniref:hypothetical protein n=1 Tax=Burkholderia sp. Bp8990 TaxID=2184552 RepID=UPI000F5B1CCF|nr:hypothetical protein [Burkholderia sp. Bp8990]RQS39798.1 hypothetical protein DIE01_16435 [Burkholderia sp. Bp8990]